MVGLMGVVVNYNSALRELNDWKWDVYDEYIDSGDMRFRKKAYLLLEIQERLLARQHKYRRSQEVRIVGGRWI